MAKTESSTIKWQKWMSFALALTAEHQRRGASDKTNWEAATQVLLIVFRNEPSTAKVLKEGHKLKGRFRSYHSEAFRVRKDAKNVDGNKNWRFGYHECTPLVRAQMRHTYAEVIRVEHAESQKPRSSVQAPRANSMVWPTFAAASEDERPIDTRWKPDGSNILESSDDEDEQLQAVDGEADLEGDKEGNIDEGKIEESNTEDEQMVVEEGPLKKKAPFSGGYANALQAIANGTSMGICQQRNAISEPHRAQNAIKKIQAGPRKTQRAFRGDDTATPVKLTITDPREGLRLLPGYEIATCVQLTGAGTALRLAKVDEAKDDMEQQQDQVIPSAAEEGRRNKQRKEQTIVKPPLQYYGDGHTEGLEPVPPLRFTWEACRQQIFSALHKRGVFTSILEAVHRTPGYSPDTFSTRVDIIDPVVASMWITKDQVGQAYIMATGWASSNFLAFQRIAVAPTSSLPWSDQDTGEPFKAFIRETRSNGSGQLAMVHSKDVDFSSGQPTCTTRSYTQAGITIGRKGPAVDLITNISTQLHLVTVDSHLHRATGEVRRVLFKDMISGQDQEVDIMLCDASICPDCQQSKSPTAHTDYHEARMGYPLVHDKDVVFLQDDASAYAPTDQITVTYTPPTTKKEIQEIYFNGIFEKGKDPIKAMVCDGENCAACQVTALRRANEKAGRFSLEQEQTEQLRRLGVDV